MKINGNTVADGTISHGTLRTEDLLKAFSDEIAKLSLRTPDIVYDARAWLEGKKAYAEHMEYDLNTSFQYQEEGSEMVQEMLEHLDSLAPENWRFGAHEGDGSDFGWWRCEDEDA